MAGIGECLACGYEFEWLLPAGGAAFERQCTFYQAKLDCTRAPALVFCSMDCLRDSLRGRRAYVRRVTLEKYSRPVWRTVPFEPEEQVASRSTEP